MSIFKRIICPCLLYIKERGDLAVAQFDGHRLHSDNEVCGPCLKVLGDELCDSPAL